MSRIPFPALFLGVAGLIPFLYGAAMLFASPDTLPTFGVVPPGPQGGLEMLERFGAVILGFMGGCLWGFAATPGRVPTLVLLGASIVPAFIAFVAQRPDPAISCVWLAFGFAVLQGIDVIFRRAGLAPEWWLNLRLPLTAIVMACLLAGALHA